MIKDARILLFENGSAGGAIPDALPIALPRNYPSWPAGAGLSPAAALAFQFFSNLAIL